MSPLSFPWFKDRSVLLCPNAQCISMAMFTFITHTTMCFETAVATNRSLFMVRDFRSPSLQMAPFRLHQRIYKLSLVFDRSCRWNIDSYENALLQWRFLGHGWYCIRDFFINNSSWLDRKGTCWKGNMWIPQIWVDAPKYAILPSTIPCSTQACFTWFLYIKASILHPSNGSMMKSYRFSSCHQRR